MAQTYYDIEGDPEGVLRADTPDGKFVLYAYRDDRLGTATTALTERFIEASMSFSFMPLPDGWWEVKVRDDRARVLFDWIVTK